MDIYKDFRASGMKKLSESRITGLRLSLRRASKRLFDITASFIGLVVLLPVWAYVAMLIRRDSPGPVFYRGPRMGRNGKPFGILKFRTMYEDSRSYAGPRITAQGDDRITPLGHWLRDTKINELPQLWNVLKGEMSLVGPRPEDVKIAQNWPKDAASEILSVRPGITSPASILYHDEEKLLSSDNLMGDYFKTILPDKIRLDRLYVRYNSFFSDIDIILWTLAIIIPRIGHSRIPEGYIFAGPLSVFVRRHVHWFTLDLVTTLIAVAVVSLTWRLSAPLNWGIGELSLLAILLAFLFSSVNALAGVNKVLWSKAQAEDAIGLTLSCAFSTVVILVLNYVQTIYPVLPYPELPFLMVLSVGLLAGMGFLLVRYRLRVVTAAAKIWLSWRKNEALVGERIIIVGNGDGVRIASWLIRQRMFGSAFSVIGLVDPANPTLHGMKIDGLWVVGGMNDIPDLLARYDAGVLLSVLPQDAPENKLLQQLSGPAKARVLFLSDLIWMMDRQVTRPSGSYEFPLSLDDHLELTALKDRLTALPSWSLFQDRLTHSLAIARRQHSSRGVVLIEVAGLDELVPDWDQVALLKGVAARIDLAKREVDTLTRYKDRFFVLLLEDIADDAQVNQVIHRLDAALLQPFDVTGRKLFVNTTIFSKFCNGNCAAAHDPQQTRVSTCFECVRKQGATMNGDELRRTEFLHAHLRNSS